jgi:hypothetical protein
VLDAVKRSSRRNKKAQRIYEKEIDIVNILQRLHDIEKLKLVFIE